MRLHVVGNGSWTLVGDEGPAFSKRHSGEGIERNMAPTNFRFGEKQLC